jgi:hypothetical protein
LLNNKQQTKPAAATGKSNHECGTRKMKTTVQQLLAGTVFCYLPQSELASVDATALHSRPGGQTTNDRDLSSSRDAAVQCFLFWHHPFLAVVGRCGRSTGPGCLFAPSCELWISGSGKGHTSALKVSLCYVGRGRAMAGRWQGDHAGDLTSAAVVAKIATLLHADRVLAGRGCMHCGCGCGCGCACGCNLFGVSSSALSLLVGCAASRHSVYGKPD